MRPTLSNLSLALACAASLLLHALLLFGRLPVLQLRPPTPLQVDLRLSEPLPPEPASPAEPLLKDTLTENPAPPPVIKPKPSPSKSLEKPRRAPPQREAALQRKLASHLYYPPAAINADMEGTVYLLFKLDEAGNIISISLAASSGHKLLDDAAIQAARSIGNLGPGDREMILPVPFRLQ